jgi:RHS repeat-associated protein
VAKYNYDAWGKVLSVTNASGTVQTSASFIGNINPIRYRGYYYDVETGFYYLQSRYYDPETGRFVNADNIVPKLSETMQDYNLYAYCADDPVNNEDPTGDKCVKCPFIGRCSYCGDFISSYMQDKSNIGTTVATAVGGGITIQLKNGWTARKDAGKPSTKTKTHIHVIKGNKEYSQNIDGSPHDGDDSSGPPNSVKKEINKKIGWDWDAKAKSWSRHQSCMIHMANCGYEEGNCQCGVGIVAGSPNYVVVPSGGTFPVFDPVYHYSFPGNFAFGF